MSRIALFTDESMLDPSTNTYTVGAAEEGVPGYTVYNEGWNSLGSAQQYVRQNNETRGITVDDALMIRASSMAAGKVR